MTIHLLLLFFVSDAIPYFGSYFGKGNGPIFYESVTCAGTETNFSKCEFHNEVTCTHSDEAGVACLEQRMS